MAIESQVAGNFNFQGANLVVGVTQRPGPFICGVNQSVFIKSNNLGNPGVVLVNVDFCSDPTGLDVIYSKVYVCDDVHTINDYVDVMGPYMFVGMLARTVGMTSFQVGCEGAGFKPSQSPFKGEASLFSQVATGAAPSTTLVDVPFVRPGLHSLSGTHTSATAWSVSVQESDSAGAFFTVAEFNGLTGAVRLGPAQVIVPNRLMRLSVGVTTGAAGVFQVALNAY